MCFIISPAVVLLLPKCRQYLGLMQRLNHRTSGSRIVSFPTMMNRTTALWILLLGSMMTSSASIWIRYLPEMPPLMIGALRTGGAALVFLPWVIRQWSVRQPQWKYLRLSILAGIALALHFATWITSLQHTTVAHSVLFVSTNPIFVIAITWGLLRQKVRTAQIAGTAIAILGMVFIQWRNLATAAGQDGTWGNLLALMGGLFAAIYLVIGKQARQELGTLIHVEVTYLTASVVLFMAAYGTGNAILPATTGEAIFILLLILLPTIGGHTIFNWGLKPLGVPVVSLFGLLEPIEAALLAFIILGEFVPLYTILGGMIILAGLGVAVWERENLT